MNSMAMNDTRRAKAASSALGGVGLASEGLVLAGIALATLAVGTALYLHFGFGFTASIAMSLILYLGLLVAHAVVHRSCAAAMNSAGRSAFSAGRGATASTELSSSASPTNDGSRVTLAPAVVEAPVDETCGMHSAPPMGHDLSRAAAVPSAEVMQHTRAPAERGPDLARPDSANASAGPKVLASQGRSHPPVPAVGSGPVVAPPPLDDRADEPVAAVPPPLTAPPENDTSVETSLNAVPPSGPPREADVAAIEALIKKLADEVNEATGEAELSEAELSEPASTELEPAGEELASESAAATGGENEQHVADEPAPAEPVRKGPVKIASQRAAMSGSRPTQSAGDQEDAPTEAPAVLSEQVISPGLEDGSAGGEAPAEDDGDARDGAALETDFITGLGMKGPADGVSGGDTGVGLSVELAEDDFVDQPVSALRDAADEMRGRDDHSANATALADIVGDVTSSLPEFAPVADEHVGDLAADSGSVGEGTSGPVAFNEEDSAVFAIVCEALDAGRVDVLLDPILGLDNRRARHFEISLRLRDIDNSVIDTEGFSERLSGSGLGTLLDRATLLRTTTVALQLETRGRRGAVFSKVAAESFGAPEFVGDVFAAFNERAGLSGQLVMTLSQAQVGRLGREEWATLQALKDLGFRFAMSGVTHLDMDFENLAQNGFAYVKFDADVFLNGLALGETRVPASDICGHLGPMGLTVIVDRIDDEAVMGQVSGLGVAFGQGQLFGGARTVKAEALRPVSGDAAA